MALSKKLFISMVIAVMTAGTAMAADKLMKQAQDLFEPIPYGPPAIKDNPITNDKIELGKMLYFEPRLSKSGFISCNSCHNVGMGGDDFQETSVGHGWQRGPRNAPTVLNSVYNVAQFWDGRASDLKEQAKGPIQAGVEMNNTPEQVVETLNSMPEYVALFEKAFPGQDDPVTFDNMARAIEAFEATLVTPDSRFDHFLKGDATALSTEEKKGLDAFVNKGCVDCHSGVNMGGDNYYPFGVMEKPASEILAGDKGRYKVTQTEGDEYLFKSPSLRNIELTAPYFHSGKVWTLRESVRVMSSAQLGISLSDEEVDQITAFLRTTTGIQPEVVYPILPATRNDTPRPAK
ncbi:cytochrome-c peroxidase [Limisalsivibrio acetivorans]|uniref:cytochrome-c peroxidase n=1 Tax=Limisalsivibrio acetivorans TaxID=1304888 RepID=UPI0003B6E638|nr:cytochrome-c peroxidase [Limisalsivibrio acetivorans]